VSKAKRKMRPDKKKTIHIRFKTRWWKSDSDIYRNAIGL